MSDKLGKKAATTLAVGALLTASGCSSLSDYTFNGVPIDRLYAESGQVATDANVDGKEAGFCETNPATCIIGGAVVVGGVVWAVSEANKNDPAPAAAPAPPPAV